MDAHQRTGQIEARCEKRGRGGIRNNSLITLDVLLCLDPNVGPLCGCEDEGNSLCDDEVFVREFEARRWPLDKWHHGDHVKLAYLYLRRHAFDEAAALIRDGIKAHNAAHGVPDSPTSGYHETMTQAWMRLVDLVMREYGPAADADAFVEQHPELSQKKTLRLFYSRERFMSPEAKVSFVEPDLAPLPRSGRPGGAP